MPRETITDLKAKLEQQGEAHFQEAGKLRAHIKAVEDQAKRAEARAAELLGENNQLRDMLRAAEHELQRRAGYMQAVEDAKPPKLIEAPRRNGTDADGYSPHNTGQVFTDHSDRDQYGFRERTAKPWWHRS